MSVIPCAKTLSYNLRVLRKKSAKTQERMADDCGISYRLYQKLEACRANPTLHSLDRIARAVKVTASDLISLKGVRTEATADEFLKEFSARFRDSRLGVGVRTYEGIALWGNRRLSELQGLNYEKGPIDIMKFLPETARTTLRFQLECELRDVVQPYINMVIMPDGESRYLRYYPTNIFPAHGSRPYYSAVYMTDIRDDSQKNYYDFCEALLRCV